MPNYSEDLFHKGYPVWVVGWVANTCIIMPLHGPTYKLRLARIQLKLNSKLGLSVTILLETLTTMMAIHALILQLLKWLQL